MLSVPSSKSILFKNIVEYIKKIIVYIKCHVIIIFNRILIEKMSV